MNSFRPQVPPQRTLGEIAGFLGARGHGESAVTLTGLGVASGEIRPGDLFVALPGANTHGATFAPAAMRAGARGVLTDDQGAGMLDPQMPFLVVPEPRERLGALAAWFYDHPARGLTVVGVTGTTGKTTVAWLVEAAMREAWSRSAVLGTVTARLDGQAMASPRTTLEAPDLHAAFAAMREAGIPGCAMEVSSHALAAHRVDGFACDVAVLTNLARDHLDFHGTVEDYHATKARLFTPDHARQGVVWLGDPHAERLAAEATIPIARIRAGNPVAPHRLSGRPGSVTAGEWAVERRGTVMVGGRPAQGFALVGPVCIESATRLIGEFNL
ncbi:MAG: Mur ligase domain-containing protein, partial [Bifidobacteriaceae bacterium]|nr:Mur ligase domain-containing protein [Bifidobacteriaceae bacterium]